MSKPAARMAHQTIKALALSALVFAQITSLGPVAHACGNGVRDGFLPENTLRIPSPTVKSSSQALSAFPGENPAAQSTDEATFNALLDRIQSTYAPIIAQKGAQFSIQRLWQDSTVNAYANRSGNQWYIQMYGGLARHSALTRDGFLLIACHEVGHHLGGSPKYTGQWAATEGQADYFATMKCLRKIWQSDDNITIVRSLSVPQTVVKQCESNFGSAQEIAICERATVAGISAAEVSRQIASGGPISVDTPDRNAVSQTYESHPQAQCRLDTYYSGSICQVSDTIDFRDNDFITGACAIEKGDKIGYRPMCWYKPSGNVSPPPSGTRAQPATILGQRNYQSSNPNQALSIQYDVSAIAGATGVYLELVGPNRDFTSTGRQPDPARLFFGSQAGTRGQISIVPARSLPNWGVYRYRILALGQNGSVAVSDFSEASTLTLTRPQLVLVRR